MSGVPSFLLPGFSDEEVTHHGKSIDTFRVSKTQDQNLYWGRLLFP